MFRWEKRIHYLNVTCKCFSCCPNLELYGFQTDSNAGKNELTAKIRSKDGVISVIATTID